MGEQLRKLTVAALVATAALGATSCAKRSTFEKDLVASQCVLVERMEVVSAVGSDEKFSVGVRCEKPGLEAYYELMSATEPTRYAVATPLKPNQVGPSAVLIYCPRTGMDSVEGVRGRIADINSLSPSTGLVVKLGNLSGDCLAQIEHLENKLTSSRSKGFDREL